MMGKDLKKTFKLPLLGPNDRFRVAWDIMGISLIVMDSFLLPASIAWDMDITPFPRKQTFGTVTLQIFAVIALLFWPTDTRQ